MGLYSQDDPNVGHPLDAVLGLRALLLDKIEDLVMFQEMIANPDEAIAIEYNGILDGRERANIACNIERSSCNE